MGFAENCELVKKNLQPDVLALVVLNVGDGDANIVVFPAKYGGRACAIVDCYDARKTIGALKLLKPKSIPFICATHPHFDHTKGLAKVIQWCLDQKIPIKQFWDSGFRHVSKTHFDLLELLKAHPEIDVIYPTSGYETVINRVGIKVLSPSIHLKNRYDTFGTNINNASIVIKLEYPPKDIAPYYHDSQEAFEKAMSEQERLKQHSVILGGDAQFDAWAKITDEFPELQKTSNRGQMINAATLKHNPLTCHVLKAPHHMSKHSLSLEVLETLRPRYTIASCSDSSKHGFPHDLTVMAVEDIHRGRSEQGMYFTGHPKNERRSGTVVSLFGESRVSPLIYGLGETMSQDAPLPELQ